MNRFHEAIYIHQPHLYNYLHPSLLIQVLEFYLLRVNSDYQLYTMINSQFSVYKLYMCVCTSTSVTVRKYGKWIVYHPFYFFSQNSCVCKFSGTVIVSNDFSVFRYFA